MAPNINDKMLLTLFLCALISAAATTGNDSDYSSSDNNGIFFRKCCPKDQALINVSKFDTGYGKLYECINSDSAKNRYNLSVSSLLIGENVEVRHSFPINCYNLQMLQYSDLEFDSLVRENKCYDRLVAEVTNDNLKLNNSKIITLTCNDTKTEDNYNSELNIDHFRKCCPKGQSYDMNNHFCRNSEQTYDEKSLVNQLTLHSNYIYEVEIRLSCEFDEYVIDLHQRDYSFSLDGSYLAIANKNNQQKSRLGQGDWCVEKDYDADEIIVRVCSRNCSALDAFCVRKCCPPGYHYRPRRCSSLSSDCVPYVDEENFFDASYFMGDSVHVDELDTMGFRAYLQCEHKKFALDNSTEIDRYILNSGGLLEMNSGPTNEYCLEVFDLRACPSNDIIRTALRCFVPEKPVRNYRIPFVVISISCVCLALTLVVYVTIPELRNLHGRNLICHVSMMLLAYCCLARVLYGNVDEFVLCILLGYAIYFGFMAAFAWLNVMCFDIWWTFGNVRNVQPLRKSSSERRRFIWYSVFAWSVAVLLTVTMYLFDRYPVSAYLDANIGIGACWFGAKENSAADWPRYIFYVVPIGIFTCINLVLWLLTARHCAQVKSEMRRLQAGSVDDRVKQRFKIDRAKYILICKLWIVMGAGWISELLSVIIEHPIWLWSIVDAFNGMQGVLIFIVLVIKPKVCFLIKKRLGLQRPGTQQFTSSSGRTSPTFLSRTIITDERTQLKTSSNNPKPE